MTGITARHPRIYLTVLVHSHKQAQGRCNEIAASQYGIISREQALAAGMSASSIARRLADGAWVAVFPAVYRYSVVAETWLGRMMAATLWAGSRSLVSHRAAARLWDLDGIGEPHIELSVYGGKAAGGVIVHRLVTDDRPPTRRRAGFLVTGVERTLFDLCSVVGSQKAALAIEDALRKRITTLDRLWDIWEACGGRGRKGTRMFRQLLAERDDRDGLLASRLEAKTLRILRRIDRPFTAQHRVEHGGRKYRLDFAFAEHKLGIDPLGLKWHFGEARWKRDLARDRVLKSLGWTILYFTWDEIHLNSDKVEAEIRHFLQMLSAAAG